MERNEIIAIMVAVRQEIERAIERYPAWPENPVEAAAIAAEESGEVVKAVNDYYWLHGPATEAEIRKEAIQAAAMWVRFLAQTKMRRHESLQEQQQPLELESLSAAVSRGNGFDDMDAEHNVEPGNHPGTMYECHQ